MAAQVEVTADGLRPRHVLRQALEAAQVEGAFRSLDAIFYHSKTVGELFGVPVSDECLLVRILIGPAYVRLRFSFMPLDLNHVRVFVADAEHGSRLGMRVDGVD